MNQDWLFLSKNNKDEYINMLAASAGIEPTDSDYFDFHYDIEVDKKKLVLRGILKHKIMQKCWQGAHDFWYIDSGYAGNNVSPTNPRGIKIYHRIVKIIYSIKKFNKDLLIVGLNWGLSYNLDVTDEES